MFPVTLNHKKSGNQILKPLRDKKEFVDAKLRSEFRQDKIIHGHRVVLAGVSSILKRHFTKSPNVDDTVVVKNIDYETLEKIVDFIYSGKIVVSEDDWDDFSNACRMINLRLGSQTDKILYDMDSDNDDEDDNEKNKPQKSDEPPIKIKKELDTDMIPTSSNVPFGDSEEPTRPRPSEDFDLPFPDSDVPTSSVNSGLISCVSGIKHKKRLKLEPTSPQIKENYTKFPDDRNPQLKTERSVSPPLLRGRNGYFWISVENVLDDVEKNVVKDTCRGSGELMDFMIDKAMKAVYAAYKSEDEAKKALETLRFNGSTACHNTTNLPSSSGTEMPPLMLSQPPPPVPPKVTLSQPPPPVPPKVTFGGFGQSPTQIPFTPRQPPPPVAPFSKQHPPPFSAQPPPFTAQPPPQPPFHSQPPPLGPFTGKPPPPLPHASHPPPFAAKPPPQSQFHSQPPPLGPFTNKPPPLPLASHPPPFASKPHSFGTVQPNMDLFSGPNVEHFPPNNSRNNRPGSSLHGSGPSRPLHEAGPQRPLHETGPPIEVYLGNLPNKTTDKWLMKYLRKKHVSFIKESIRIFEAPAKLAPTKNKTYGFVHCATRKDADHFIKTLNGKPCRKRNLVVKDAAEGKKKKQRMLETSEGVLGSLPPEDEGQESPFGGDGVLGSQPSEMEIEEGVAGYEWEEEPSDEEEMTEGHPHGMETNFKPQDQEWKGFQRRDSAGRGKRGNHSSIGGMARDEDGWDWKRSHKRGSFSGGRQPPAMDQNSYEPPAFSGMENEEVKKNTELEEVQKKSESKSSLGGSVAVCEPDSRGIPSLLDIVIQNPT